MQSPMKLRKDEEASNVSFRDDIGVMTLGIVRRKKRPPKKKTVSLLLRWVTASEKILSKKDIMVEVFFCFDLFFNALLIWPFHNT